MNNRKIIAYKHVAAKQLENLPEKVNEYIRQGWQPFGIPIMGEDRWWEIPVVMYEQN